MRYIGIIVVFRKHVLLPSPYRALKAQMHKSRMYRPAPNGEKKIEKNTLEIMSLQQPVTLLTRPSLKLQKVAAVTQIGRQNWQDNNPGTFDILWGIVNKMTISSMKF